MLTEKLPHGPHYANATDLKSFQKLKYISAMQHNPLLPYWLDKALQKTLSIYPSARHEALSEWYQDLKRPNPKWLTQRQLPLMERYPNKVWKLLAFSG